MTKVISMLLFFLLGCFVSLPLRDVSNELKDLNSKIDKIIIFLDLDLNEEGKTEE